MTAVLEGGEWPAARPGRTLPPGKTRYPFYRRLGGPQDPAGRTENLVPTGIRSRTVQPVVSRHTDWATRPTIQLVHYINIGQTIALCNMAGTEELCFFLLWLGSKYRPGQVRAHIFLWDRQRLSSGGWPGRPAHSISHCDPSVLLSPSFRIGRKVSYRKNISRKFNSNTLQLAMPRNWCAINVIVAPCICVESLQFINQRTHI